MQINTMNHRLTRLQEPLKNFVNEVIIVKESQLGKPENSTGRLDEKIVSDDSMYTLRTLVLMRHRVKKPKKYFLAFLNLIN